MWTLISYSEVKLPLKPYLLEYVLGIIEDENGERFIVRVDKKHAKDISIGVKGIIKESTGPCGKINIFVPSLVDEPGEKQRESLNRKIGREVLSERGLWDGNWQN